MGIKRTLATFAILALLTEQASAIQLLSPSDHSKDTKEAWGSMIDMNSMTEHTLKKNSKGEPVPQDPKKQEEE
jgi:hypothetical protein